MFEYHCDCRSTTGTFKKTKVYKFGESVGLCRYCKHYPVTKPIMTLQKRIIKLFNEGYSQQNIAKQVGCKSLNVRYHLLQAGLVQKDEWTDNTQKYFEEL
jgi:hypothetical protein